MTEEFSRTERLLGNQAMQCLSEARVAVFGVVELEDMWWKLLPEAVWERWI